MHRKHIKQAYYKGYNIYLQWDRIKTEFQLQQGTSLFVIWQVLALIKNKLNYYSLYIYRGGFCHFQRF